MIFIKQLIGILILTLGVFFRAHAQDPFTNGLVADYPFNGNANDASGNGNSGMVQGATVTTNRFGTPNSAYYFDGVSSRIQIPETLFGPSVVGVTISAWVTTDNGPYTGSPQIFEKSGQNGTMVLQITSGQFSFGPKLNTQSLYFAGTPTILNSVTHLVGVYQKGQSVSLYTNGVLASSISVPDDTLFVETGGYPLISAIGIYDYVPAPYFGFRGVIDDVRVYTNALTASQVQQLYAYESTPTPTTCLPHRATATPILDYGFVVAATITDGGCGYTNTPLVVIQGGGGTGATATAVVSNGVVVGITITDAGIGYTGSPTISIYSPFGLQIGLMKAVKSTFSDLLIGTNYQLQVSGDLNNWTNQGSAFTATNLNMGYPQYWDVDDWGSLFFRLQVSP